MTNNHYNFGKCSAFVFISNHALTWLKFAEACINNSYFDGADSCQKCMKGKSAILLFRALISPLEALTLMSKSGLDQNIHVHIEL